MQHFGKHLQNLSMWRIFKECVAKILHYYLINGRLSPEHNSCELRHHRQTIKISLLLERAPHGFRAITLLAKNT